MRRGLVLEEGEKEMWSWFCECWGSVLSFNAPQGVKEKNGH